MDKESYDNADEALQVLRKSLDKAQDDEDVVIVVAPHHAKAIKQVGEFWHSMSGFVAITSSFGSLLKWVLAFGLAWAALKAGFLDWVQQGINSPK